MRSLAAVLCVAATFAGLVSVTQAAPAGSGLGRWVQLQARAVWVAPPVDVEALRREDVERRATPGYPARVAERFKAGLDPQHAGTWEPDSGSGVRVWRLRVRSPGALWIGLGFTEFRLPSGASLTVRGVAHGESRGPYGVNDVREHGQLWVPPLEGEAADLELVWPSASTPATPTATPKLYLGWLSHGYEVWGDLGKSTREVQQAVTGTETLAPDSGFCNIDVNCPLGSAWQQQKLGVVQLLIGGQFSCTGSFVNNTALDCHPYILTASHCYRPPQQPPIDPATTVVRFNYERPACGSGTAPQDQLATGISKVAESSNSDFLLLRLDASPPSNFAHYFNGWNRSSAPATQCWSIHHPTGDPRKISFDDDAPIDGQFFGPFHWRLSEWEIGTTEGGSSGAPIFDENQRIVGQLHGGEAACDEFRWDEFGKFSASWSWLGEPSVRLREWLDPVDSGVTVLDGLDPGFCADPRPRLVRRSVQVGDHPGNRDGILDPGDRFTVAVELHNSGTAPATGVQATLLPLDARVTVLNGPVTWPDMPPLASQFGAVPFAVELAPDFPCGTPVLFTLSVSSDQVALNSSLSLPTGTISYTTLFEDDVETGTNGWTSQSATGAGLNANAFTRSEVRSVNGDFSWFVPNIPLRSDTRLIFPPLTVLPSRPILTFWHYINSDPGFDGGVLEFSLNGTTWFDAGSMIREGGYNSVLSGATGSALGGRSAWSGDLGNFQRVEVDLSSRAGQTIQLRFRFATDLSNEDEGWYIDDVQLANATSICRSRGNRCQNGSDCQSGRPTPSRPR
jgi:hypothetical protein